ncbi:hypothetical protein B0J12DRAFT_22378 [Macrophomina phaseolina]|uniref:Uncharacterized protein n=1 Tax=Macrophomina phaseolina TaxID=35725 RepID=A0ABQ8GUS3_9PEZI|nr:hypothetical protein B0J12DRAFT_22378 [Macrophomina phaseolina]
MSTYHSLSPRLYPAQCHGAGAQAPFTSSCVYLNPQSPANNFGFLPQPYLFGLPHYLDCILHKDLPQAAAMHFILLILLAGLVGLVNPVASQQIYAGFFWCDDISDTSNNNCINYCAAWSGTATDNCKRTDEGKYISKCLDLPGDVFHLVCQCNCYPPSSSEAS